MNRTTKFRGKRVDTGEWVEGYFWKRVFSGIECFYIRSLDTNDDFPVIPETVGQFTGLHGKKGKEIYEGDYIHIAPGYSSKVEFIDGCFMSVYEHTEDGEIIPLFDVIGKETIVLYSIHDNPELLKP